MTLLLKPIVFQAIVKEGFQIISAPDVKDGHVEWSHPAGPDAKIRYTKRRTPEGDWHEIGEFCRGEDPCVKTLEMRLSKISAEGN